MIQFSYGNYYSTISPHIVLYHFEITKLNILAYLETFMIAYNSIKFLCILLFSVVTVYVFN